MEDLAQASLDLVMLEEYKTTGELKGPAELVRAFTPAAIRRLTQEEDEPESTGSGLPKLPSLKGSLPALPKLSSLGQ